MEDQAGWPAHAAFMDGLLESGFIVLGGPLDADNRVALAIEAESQEAVDVIDPDCLAAEPRGGDRGISGAGRDVEDAPAGMQVGGVHEVLGDEDDAGADHGVVAARPRLLLARLDGGEIGLCVER
jgi:hypothetical protein